VSRPPERLDKADKADKRAKAEARVEGKGSGKAARGDRAERTAKPARAGRPERARQEAPNDEAPAARDQRATTPADAPARPTPRPAGPPPKAKKPVVAFPRKNQPPAADAFAARLPLPLGRRFDMTRTYLLRQRGVSEEVYFYGPAAGFALRYLIEGRPLCSLHVYDEKPVGIVSLDPEALAAIDWKALSPVAQRARQVAHGSHNRAWLDLPLEATGAADFKTIVKSKVAVMVEAVRAASANRAPAEGDPAPASDDDSP
jgi:hypothetical protein